jgi:hypothetical protein
VTSVVVLGAGELGGAAAAAVAASGAAQRVTIVDDAVDVARGIALDVRQCGPVLGVETAVAGTGDLAAVVGAAAVIVADRHGARVEWSGDDGLQLLARVRGLNPGALVICAGATQLPLVERAVLEQGTDRRRLVGAAPEALRAAIVALTSLEAGCHPRDVSLAVLGAVDRRRDRRRARHRRAGPAGAAAAGSAAGADVAARTVHLGRGREPRRRHGALRRTRHGVSVCGARTHR